MTPEEEAAEVLSNAVGTLQEWFDDYSPPFEGDGRQRHITHYEYHDDGLTFAVTTLGPEIDLRPRKFRARVTLEALDG